MCIFSVTFSTSSTFHVTMHDNCFLFCEALFFLLASAPVEPEDLMKAAESAELLKLEATEKLNGSSKVIVITCILGYSSYDYVV